MDNCSQHKKSVLGEADMKIVAEAIVNLHYESLPELFRYLAQGFESASVTDYWDNKKKLGRKLMQISGHMGLAAFDAKDAFEISKPFMDQTT